MKLIILTLTFCVLVFVQGCATPTYRLYNGGPLAKEQLAVLHDTPGRWQSSVYIDAVDGLVSTDKRGNWYGSNWDGSFRIELLPGTHTLTVRLLGGDWYGNGVTTVTFTAEAGKTYVVNYSIDTVSRNESQIGLMSKSISISSQWHAWVEEDKGKD